MIGNICLCVDMGDNQRVEQSFGVLEGTVTIRKLGRDFLKKLGQLNLTGTHREFD